MAENLATAKGFDYTRTEKRKRNLSIIAFVIFVALCLSSTTSGNDRQKAISLISNSVLGKNSEANADELQCVKSMRASYDFICESDRSWDLRKEVFEKQEKVQVQPAKDYYYWKQMGIWFQNNYEPNFSCRHERRIGRPGDGGKWVCNPYRIQEMARSRKQKCVVFSIGSNNDFSFEEAILQDIPECEVHTFDHTINPSHVPAGVKFHRWGLGTRNEGNVKTLSTMLKELKIGENHSIEILKVDIEGQGAPKFSLEDIILQTEVFGNTLRGKCTTLTCIQFDSLCVWLFFPSTNCVGTEWKVFVGSDSGPDQGLLSRGDFPFVRQILIELHPKTSISATKNFFKLMEAQQYVITHKEPNTYQGGELTEYAFLKADMAR